MAATAKKKGDLSFRERPDSPEWDFGTRKITCTRTFEGMYEDVLNRRPKVGASMEGYAPLLVENAKVKKAVSGKTTLIVTLQIETDAVEADSPEPFQPTYEIDWTQVERPLEQAAYFRVLFEAPTSAEEIDKHYSALEKWRDASSDQKAQAFKDLGTADTTGKLQELVSYLMIGDTTTLLFAPVARITSLARNVTKADTCGKVYSEVPGFTELPSGYKWLYTADRSQRVGTGGKWQRSQEWTGAEWWNPRSYPSATSGSDSSEADPTAPA